MGTKFKFNPLTGEFDLVDPNTTTDSTAIHDNIASEISGITEKVTPVSNDLILIEDSADSNNKKKLKVGNLPTGGGGEANTASNQGVAGVGVYDSKVGIDLQFKNINAGSNKISITDDITNKEVDIDVIESNLTLSNLGGSVTDAQVPDTITLSNITQITNRSHTDLSDIGTNTHTQIDTHISDSSIHYPQSSISIPASQISDFDTEVSNNTTVTSNTSFRTTPSSVITAGTNLSWSGNTLNATSGSSVLSDLSDVTITTPADNEVLAYDNTSGDWINQTAAESGLATASDLTSHTGDSTIHFTQSAINIPASQISDFDTEVSNNIDVSANTSDRHVAVTVLDSAEIDFTLTGQQITASLIASSIDETKLDTSVNASLNLADSAIQAGDLATVATSGSHTDLSNIGTNTHVQIDSHIADTSIHFSDLSGFSTSDLGEGTNLYFTDERVDDRTANLIQNGTGISWTYDDVANTLTPTVSINSFPVGDLSNVTTTTPTKNEVLIYNGSTWVNAPDGTTFTFSCTGFDDGLTSGILAGSGVWKSASTISFTATYNNGPPTTATIEKSINGGTYTTLNSMTGPDYTTGTNSSSVNYPTVDQYLRFRLSSDDGTDSDIDYAGSLYFYNYVRWGPSTTGSSFTESIVEALSGSSVTNSYTTSRSVNAGVGEYVVWAYPSRYTSINTTGAKFNSVTMPFTAPETVSITNTAGLTENYKVFASVNTNLGNSTLQLSTSSTTIDPLYYGKTTKTSGFTESDIEGLTNSTITNDNTQVWNSITTGSGEYMLFAFPTRLGIPVFYVGGFAGGFESPETVSVTNINGYTENYYAWRSTNSNLGATVVETKAT